MPPPTPAPSEGRPKFTIEVYEISGVTQWAIKVDGKLRSSGPVSTGTFMASIIEDVANWAIQSAHSSAPASLEVADLVKAAREVVEYYQNMSGNPNCPIPDKYWISGAISLRTALAPFAGGGE